MTVCVAAICQSFFQGDQRLMVVGAADRMLTAGDIEFEPEQPKILQLTNSVFIMLAGDAALQVEIVRELYGVVTAQVTAEPSNWWKVADIAELYSRIYSKAVAKRAELEILMPLGLDRRTFIDEQRSMAPELVRELASNLLNFQPESSVAALVCGIDNLGAHIYRVANSRVYCMDGVSFASIGVGDWHSNSQFMFAKHTRMKGFGETLLLTYSAKKRAEVAPGVGEATDMFIVGPTLGQNVHPLGDHVLKELEDIYKTSQDNILKAGRDANVRISNFVAEILKKAPQSQATTPPVTTTPAPSSAPPSGAA